VLEHCHPALVIELHPACFSSSIGSCLLTAYPPRCCRSSPEPPPATTHLLCHRALSSHPASTTSTPPRHVDKPPTVKPCPAGRPCAASAPWSTPPHLAYLPSDDGRVAMAALATVTTHAARTSAVAGRPDAPRLVGCCLMSRRQPVQAGQATTEPAMGCGTRQAASPNGPPGHGLKDVPLCHGLQAESRPNSHIPFFKILF
jgi:hypothetical protein